MIVRPSRILNPVEARAGVDKAEVARAEEAVMVVNSEDVVMAMVLAVAEKDEVVAAEIAAKVFPVVDPIEGAVVAPKAGEVGILPRVVWGSWELQRASSVLTT